MTKYLTRQVMGNCMGNLGQERVTGRAKVSLEVQGRGQKGSDIRVARFHEILDKWQFGLGPHHAWDCKWVGRTQFETSEGSWKEVVHRRPRRAFMTPTGVASLRFPDGVDWTGRRVT